VVYADLFFYWVSPIVQNDPDFTVITYTFKAAGSIAFQRSIFLGIKKREKLMQLSYKSGKRTRLPIL
jgi:hypothetical protein